MATELETLRAKVEAAQALAAKATPGPYIVHPRAHTSGWGTCVGPGNEMIARMTGGRGSSPKQRAKDAAMLAAAPDLVSHLTDALALAESQAAQLDQADAAIDMHCDAWAWVHYALGVRALGRPITEPPQSGSLASDIIRAIEERDEARAELTAIRAALGNGADEAAWRPGETLAEVVGRLRGEHHSLRDVLQWVNDQCPGKCSAACDSALRAGHEGPHAEALGDNGGPNG